ncbi:MAG TPA: BrxE family protein [Anaerolineae bacterium]|nr:BrxE family protein [Anaerolineae bacterium]
MESPLLDYLAKLRVVVGYLGEREQFGWWQSSFFSASSQAFLAPVFARTQFLAQCAGVTRAAAKVHDERIGTGHVYHLFRLPEDMEQDLHQLLHSPQLAQAVTRFTTNQETALNFLQQEADAIKATALGPIRINKTEALRDLSQWRMVCAHYSRGFRQTVEIFPYFADSV